MTDFDDNLLGSMKEMMMGAIGLLIFYCFFKLWTSPVSTAFGKALDGAGNLTSKTLDTAAWFMSSPYTFVFGLALSAVTVAVGRRLACRMDQKCYFEMKQRALDLKEKSKTVQKLQKQRNAEAARKIGRQMNIYNKKSNIVTVSKTARATAKALDNSKNIMRRVFRLPGRLSGAVLKPSERVIRAFPKEGKQLVGKALRKGTGKLLAGGVP